MGLASRLRPTTIRIPVRSEDSSLASDMPSSTLSRTSSLIFLMMLVVLTPYGTSVNTKEILPLADTSSSFFALMTTLPRPVW